MLTGLFQAAVILDVAVSFYVIDFILIARYDQRRKANGSGRSWDFTLLMFTAVILVAAQPLLLPWLGLQIKASWGLAIQVVGLILLGAGLGLNVWSRFHLRQFYAERVEIQPQHVIVQSGPYAYVRHPVFTSLFILVAGLLLVNPALPTLLLAGYTIWDFSRAARQEEDLLKEQLPGYREYMAKTSAFFPRLDQLGKGIARHES